MRPLLSSLSPQDRQQLLGLMLQYITDAVVAVHNSGHDWHHFQPSPDLFFRRHRGYLAGMETFLAGRGATEFVPLPMWDPALPIPPEFMVVKPRDTGATRPALIDATPGLPRPAGISLPALCNFPDINAVADATELWHDSVHNNIGGSIAFRSTAPAAPIFWCWHAFIDEIYDEWLRCTSQDNPDYLYTTSLLERDQPLYGDALPLHSPTGGRRAD
jgi:hypothetical protein